MAATARHERDMVRKAEKTFEETTDPLEKLRAACLSRGASGIKGLGRVFRIMDDDGNKQLNFSEFTKGIHDYGLTMDKKQAKDLFDDIDADSSGQISFDEFLVRLRPPMSKARVKLIDQAFAKLDRTHDGEVTVDDLRGVYDVKHHPKFVSGDMTEDQVYKEFLDSFDTPGQGDGIVTQEEFQNYYAGVSASIDEDAYFDLMMRKAWKL